MILSKRQLSIFKYLIENHDEYVTSKELAQIFNVSSRTIKSEFPHLRAYAERFSSFEFDSSPGQGVTITVLDTERFIMEIIEVTNYEVPLSNVSEADLSLLILKMIVTTSRYLGKDEIINKFHISESSFYKAYNAIKDMIKPFNLELQNSKTKGYSIEGNEISIRNLIAKKELNDNHRGNMSEFKDISIIYDFVADVFIDYEYTITETLLQNLSSHIKLMIDRVRQKNYIENTDTDVSIKEFKEYEIAKTICDRFISDLKMESIYFENEVSLLTQTILGKTNYFFDEDLHSRINHFLSQSLDKIKEKFGLNFSTNEKLRLYLALHLVPLIYRIKSQTELNNIMKIEIEQQFLHANDIALYFSLLFKEEFNLNISQDELSYITLYINYGIEELNILQSSKHILVITNLRTSETILIRHKLLNWFPNQIMEITFKKPTEEIDELEQYDAVFATDLFSERYHNAVTLINKFPTDKDYNRINLALNGFTSSGAILEKFDESRYFKTKKSTKKEMLYQLCESSKEMTQSLDEDFFDIIWSRESIASTYFGNLVALPHPLAPVTDETFATIGISEESIDWDGKDVRLVILISIEKNNPRALQFWYYLADIIRDEMVVSRLLKTKRFDEFISVLSDVLSTLEYNPIN